MHPSYKHFSYLRFLHSIFLIVSFLSPAFITKGGIPIPKINIKRASFVQSISSPPEEITSPTTITHFSGSQIIAAIQQSRKSINLETLIVDQESCAPSKDLLDKTLEGVNLTNDDLSVFCAGCIGNAYISTQGNYNVPEVDPWMITENITQFTHDEFTHLCVIEQDENVLVLLGNSPQESPSQEPIYQEVSPIDFTSDQLWQALAEYRRSHKKAALQLSTNLCDYASKRVEEHILMQESGKPADEYKNADKYPLDSHEGFSRDGDSEYLFEVTGFSMVGENLAYWPDAQAPNQVIEWGWDASIEGHREAQLSEEYSHACVVGRKGFFVAIFANN